MRDTGLRFVNFLLHFTVVLCLALACRAQSASNIPNTISIQASGAPSGACGNNFIYTNSATNDFYNCVAGAWNKVAGSGGSGTVTSIATTGPIGGGTITTTGTITCTTCVTSSSPGVGLAHFAGSTQAVTSSAVNLAGADVTGNLPVTNLNSGTSASSSTFWRGDGTWVAPASGALVLLCEGTASNSATLNFSASTNCSGVAPFTSTYDDYVIRWNSIIPASASILEFRITTDGTTYLTTNYTWEFTCSYTTLSSGAACGTGSNSATSIQLRDNTTTLAANGSWSGEMNVSNPLGALIKNFHGQTIVNDNSVSTLQFNGGGSYTQTTAIVGVQMLASTGNLTSGTVRIYGVTK